jgi:hypothetical protein
MLQIHILVGKIMNKKIQLTTIAALMILIISLSSVSAVIGQTSEETRANRIVEVAENAAEKVGDLIHIISSNSTILEIIDDAELTDALDGNISVYNAGLENVTNANECLLVEDYDGANANATEALTIFREVYRSIHIILYEAEVTFGQYIDADQLEEGIDRSIARVDELKKLISKDAPIYNNLVEAEQLLLQAKTEFLSDNITAAKTDLRASNVLISEVCQYLKEAAQELNPSRIRDYCEDALRFRERFRERFGQAESEGFDVNGFLQGLGFHNEDDFMARFEEMVEYAQQTGDINDALGNLQEIGNTIRNMDSNLTHEMGQFRAMHGQGVNGQMQGSGDNGQYGGSQGVNGGSGQMGSGGGH